MLTLILVLIIINYLFARAKKGKSIKLTEIFRDVLCWPAVFGVCTVLIIIYGSMIDYVANYTSNVIKENSYYTEIICRKAKIETLEKEYHDTLGDLELYSESQEKWQATLDKILDEIYDNKDAIEEARDNLNKMQKTSIRRLHLYEFLLYFKIPTN